MKIPISFDAYVNSETLDDSRMMNMAASQVAKRARESFLGKIEQAKIIKHDRAKTEVAAGRTATTATGGKAV